MKKEDVNRIYSIPFSILDDYESLHLTKQEEYDEEDIEKLYLLGDQTKLQRIKILKRKRQQLLDHIHDTQKELDALDCLLYKVNG